MAKKNFQNMSAEEFDNISGKEIREMDFEESRGYAQRWMLEAEKDIARAKQIFREVV